VPLVIVNVAPEFVQPPALLELTARPELAVAATVNDPPYSLLAGEAVDTEIV
jgi:hypothetical protein